MRRREAKRFNRYSLSVGLVLGALSINHQLVRADHGEPVYQVPQSYEMNAVKELAAYTLALSHEAYYRASAAYCPPSAWSCSDLEGLALGDLEELKYTANLFFNETRRYGVRPQDLLEEFVDLFGAYQLVTENNNYIYLTAYNYDQNLFESLFRNIEGLSLYFVAYQRPSDYLVYSPVRGRCYGIPNFVFHYPVYDYRHQYASWGLVIQVGIDYRVIERRFPHFRTRSYRYSHAVRVNRLSHRNRINTWYRSRRVHSIPRVNPGYGSTVHPRHVGGAHGSRYIPRSSSRGSTVIRGSSSGSRHRIQPRSGASSGRSLRSRSQAGRSMRATPQGRTSRARRPGR